VSLDLYSSRCSGSDLSPSGAFSVVRLALNQKTKQQSACKMMRIVFLKQRGYLSSIKEEISVMRELSHVGLGDTESRYFKKLTQRTIAKSSGPAGGFRRQRLCLHVHGLVSEENHAPAKGILSHPEQSHWRRSLHLYYAEETARCIGSKVHLLSDAARNSGMCCIEARYG
jgi:serine/threonine protein kinase